MTSSGSSQSAIAAASLKRVGVGARVGQAMLMGAVLFFVVGTIEAAVLCVLETYPEPLAFLRKAVLAFVALGLVVGLIWGLACGLAAWRMPTHFHWTSLAVLAITFMLNVYTQKDAWRSTELGNLGIPLLVIIAAEWVLGLGIIVAAALFRRRNADHTGNVLRRPRAVFWALASVAVVLGLLPEIRFGASGGTLERCPNILLIVMDTTRLDRLSAYGYGRPTTPALERIAREGVLFTRAYAPAPWTLPSHASIFTGLPSAVHGATREHMYLDERYTTLAEALTGRGIRSVAITKKEYLWKDTGVMRGFAQHFDFYGVQRESALFEAGKLFARLVGVRPADGGAAQVNRTAKRWLRLNGPRPFFMFLNYNEPHAPLAPPAPFREQYLGDRAHTPWGREKFPDYVGYSSGSVSYTERELEIINDLYDAEVAYQDYRMGQLFDFLRSRGVLDDTLLIIAADHGENLGDHERLGHAYCLYETLVHVPLVVRFPRMIPAGMVVDQPVTIRRIWSLIDRVLAQPASGGHLKEDALVAALSHEERAGVVFAEEYRLTPHEAAGHRWTTVQHGDLARRRIHRWSTSPRRELAQRRLKCVIDSRYKYIWASDESGEYYDLLEDPREQTNLISTKSDDLAQLQQRLLDEARLWQEPDVGPAPRLGDELLERLRALGYIE